LLVSVVEEKSPLHAKALFSNIRIIWASSLYYESAWSRRIRSLYYCRFRIYCTRRL